MIHARISPSASARWIACPPSVRLGEQYPDDTSTFAEEGTLAHHYAETLLRCENGEITRDEADAEIEKVKAHELYAPEMDGHVHTYTSTVLTEFNRLKALGPAELIIEEKLDISEYVPGGHGFADAIIVTSVLVIVFDLKYGMSRVEAQDNPQAKLYALGVLELFRNTGDIRYVETVIVQPRLRSTPRAVYSAKELISWGYETAKPAAIMADKGLGELKAGAHCKYCKVRFDCAERTRAAVAEAQLKFKDIAPETLPIEDVALAVRQTEFFSAWLKDARSYLTKQALAGVKVPHYKLVLAKANRKISDPEGLLKELRRKKYGLKKAEYTNEKPVGIGALEGLLGVDRVEDELSPFITRPEGRPVLADEDDDRPLYGLAKAKSVFDVLTEPAD